MARKLTLFESGDGSRYETELEACLHDLRIDMARRSRMAVGFFIELEARRAWADMYLERRRKLVVALQEKSTA